MYEQVMNQAKGARYNLDSSLKQYLTEISKYKLISPEEEFDLTVKIREGNLEAQNRMIMANLKFVVSIAKLYQNQGLTLGDLINEGNLGLIKATKLFDETRGFKFISYAVWWIRQAIMSAISEQSRVVRLPLNRISDIGKMKKAYRELEKKYERKPTPEELARYLHLPVDEVTFTLQTLNKELSIDTPLDPNEEDSDTLIDTIPDMNEGSPDKALFKESMKEDIEDMLTILDERERIIVKMSLGIGRMRPATLEEIGDHFHLTRERIRQIKERALRKLRHSEKKNMLIEYLN